jgi:peroxiredoxin
LTRYVDVRRLALLILIAAVAVGGLALTGLFRGGSGSTVEEAPAIQVQSEPAAAAGPVEAKQGAFAPDFEATTLTGERVRLSDFRGRPVVLNFWGTTCVSCLAEIPHLERVWKEQAGKGLVVLGINVGDDRQRAEAFFRELAATYPSVLDPRQTLARAYRAPGLPMTVFIRPDGRIERIVAGEISYTIFNRYARLILGEKDVAGLNDPLPIRFVSPLPPSE